MSRPVPRNIDKPDRTIEFVVAFIAVYFPIMFFTRQALAAIGLGFIAVYLIYKYTLDKPEGLAMRMLYRHVQLGRLRPSPKTAPKLEV